jgi:hypothetical protein
MERDDLSRYGRNHYHSQRTQREVEATPIVDDPRSSNPHSLLPWLKRQLQTFAPVNNATYNPTLPTAS